MTYTDKGSELTQRLKDLIEGRKSQLGIAEVYYGDQNLIPTFPSVICESSDKTRLLQETGFNYQLILNTLIIVYHGEVTSPEVNKKEVEELAEAIESVVMEDNTLSGLVVHGYISRLTYGIAAKGSVFLKASRLLYEATTKRPR